MRPVLLVAMAAGCLERPYPPYFEDEEAAPALLGVTYDPATGPGGGTEATLQGERLGATRTVVVGGRNATILEATETFVRVELPSHAPSPTPLDVVVVTDDGVGRLDEAVRYASAIGDFAVDERVSVALGTLGCPIEQWGQIDGELDTILFCGGELGFSDAIALPGATTQPGYATEILGFAPVTTAPPPGQVRFWGPGDRRPPSTPVELGPQAEGDAIHLVARRDFRADFDVVERALATVEATYFWAFAIDEVALVVGLEDGEQSFLELVDVLDVAADQITLASPAPPGTVAAQLGYRFVERYPDEGLEFETVAFFGTAEVEVEGDALRARGAGVELVYDSFSGFFFPETLLGPIDIGEGPFDVSTVRLDEATALGSIRGAPPFAGQAPDLMTGDQVIRSDRPFFFTWNPVDSGGDPSVVVLELKVFDYGIDDPNGGTELFRITATALDEDGIAGIPRDLLERLPARIDNEFDLNYDFAGLWGELTVARHTLRKLPLPDDGDLVVDFVHATSANVAILR